MSRSSHRETKGSKQKEAIRLIKKMDELSKLMRGQPWIPLEVPERAGWQRYFIVRPDIARSPQGPRLERLLNKHLQNVVRSPRKDFKKQNYKTKVWEPIEQRLKMITKKDYDTLSPAEKNMFSYMKIKRKGWPTGVWYEECFIFDKEWQFEMRIKPYYYTHRQVVNGDLERQYQEVSDQFYGGLMWRYIDRKWTNWEPYDRHPKTVLASIVEREERASI